MSARAAEVTGTQSQKATGDAVAMGVGLIVFWPAVFFIKGDQQSAAELARLRGELDAIQQASIANNCGLRIEVYKEPPKPKPIPPSTEPGQVPVRPPRTLTPIGPLDPNSPIH